MKNKGFVFKVDDIDKNQEGAIEKVAKDFAKELDINALEKTLEYITGEEVNKSCEDFNNGYRTALYRVMSLVTNQQQELERYKNIVEELKKEKSKKYDYVREVRTFNNNISKKDLEKFPALKQYQGKDISYIVYESIDIL